MYQQTHHPPDCEVRTLLLLFTILEHIVERENTWRNQIVRLQKVEVLVGSARIAKSNKKSKAYLMVDAEFHILAPLLLLFDETCRERSTSGVNDATTLFPLDRRMQTKVFTRSETQSSKVLDIAKLLGSVIHQSFQFRESLFNLRHCT
jgi:hypothetical protein